jgi:hypothetical protein
LNNWTQAHRSSKPILNSSSSALWSTSPCVSICKSVPLRSSHTITTGEAVGPHSSGKVPASERRLAYQHVVPIDPSDVDSARNLFKSVARGREAGGIKSQGSKTKSSRIRFEKWRSSWQVPVMESWDSSYVCKSIRRTAEVILEWIWWDIIARWEAGQISSTSGQDCQISRRDLRYETKPFMPDCSIQDKV